MISSPTPREQFYYLHDVYNYLDLIGIVSLMPAIILRWINYDVPELASFAFLFNYIRSFKYLSAFR